MNVSKGQLMEILPPVGHDTCNFVTLNGLDGKFCKKKKEYGAAYCSMANHNIFNSAINCKKLMKRKTFYQIFVGNSVGIEHYHFEDVLGDDACLFRSLSLGLFANLEGIKYSEQVKKIFTHPETDPGEGVINIRDETEFSKRLQESARKWIVINRGLTLDSHGGETVESLVCGTHEIESIETYAQLYSVFAGEFNKAYDVDGKLVDIDPRWGGLPEQIAISDIFEVDINVYVPRKVNSKFDTIIPSYKLLKGTRLQLYTSVKFDGARDDREIPLIELLLLDLKTKPHYQLMLRCDVEEGGEGGGEGGEEGDEEGDEEEGEDSDEDDLPPLPPDMNDPDQLD